ncbi:MAG: tol-pal system protein YbgF, partial [Alphaproteobacteria bacterium]|nr:tol-pal system protein YbgF [Alphaproteobacteria bacterium]
LELATRQNSCSNRARATDETQVLGTLSAPLPVEQITTGEAVSLVGEAPLDNGRTLATVPPSQTQQNANTPSGTPPDPRELYDSALDKLRQGAYGDAQMQLANFLQFYPKHSLAGNAQYWLGETHYVQRNFKAAAAAFLRGYTDYAESRKAPDSLLKLGMTLIMMGEKSTGCDAFAELASRFPDASQPVIQRAEIERQRADCL